MADRDALNAEVMAALRAAKPVTREQALAIALAIIAPQDAKAAAQFQSWFNANGSAVVEMINA